MLAHTGKHLWEGERATSGPVLRTMNTNGFHRDTVEKAASYAVMSAFLIFAVYTIMSNDAGLLDMLAVYLYGEMRAITVGRGEGGTFEGKNHGESKEQ